MKPLFRSILAIVAAAAWAQAAENSPAAGTIMPRPTAVQLAWQEAELGVLIDIDPRIYNSDHGYQTLQPCRTPLKDPMAYANKFNPEKLDTDQWVAAAKAMGAKFAILEAKHEVGFCLWQSDASPYSLKAIKWRDGKGDILRDFVVSCKKYGIKPGVFTEARWDKRLAVSDFKVTKDSPVTQAEYNRLIEREVEEICTRYGDLFEIWFDGGVRTPEQGGPDVLPIAEKHQPNMIFYHSDQRRDVRWGGTESGTVGYPCWATVPVNVQHGDKHARNGDADGTRWQPAMSDTPLRCANGRHCWHWEIGSDNGLAPLKTLQNMYYGSVGRNSTLIVGLTPDRSGLLPENDVARCKEFGAWLEQAFGGKPLAETSGKGTELLLERPADAKIPVTHVILREEIKDGERVREYVVEAQVDGAWKALCAGSCVGQKRIERIAPCEARKFRLRVTKSVGEPQIRAFSIR